MCIRDRHRITIVTHPHEHIDDQRRQDLGDRVAFVAEEARYLEYHRAVGDGPQA